MPSNSSAVGYRIGGEWDHRETKAALWALAPRQWTFVEALAITRTAQSVKSAEKGTMRAVFDRPTPFTLNSLYLKTATVRDLSARVWFKDFAPKGTPAGDYLMPEVHGGNRRHKRFEGHLRRSGYLANGRYLVPASGAPLDSYGNVNRGVYTRVLSQLGAQLDRAQNTTRRSARRQPNRPTYFYGSPGGKGQGIWQRFAFAVGSAVKPIFIEGDQPTYRTRFDFFGVGERTAARVMPSAFESAALYTLRTAR